MKRIIDVENCHFSLKISPSFHNHKEDHLTFITMVSKIPKHSILHSYRESILTVTGLGELKLHITVKGKWSTESLFVTPPIIPSAVWGFHHDFLFPKFLNCSMPSIHSGVLSVCVTEHWRVKSYSKNCNQWPWSTRENVLPRWALHSCGSQRSSQLFPIHQHSDFWTRPKYRRRVLCNNEGMTNLMPK